jgi:hypothetical protein
MTGGVSLPGGAGSFELGTSASGAGLSAVFKETSSTPLSPSAASSSTRSASPARQHHQQHQQRTHHPTADFSSASSGGVVGPLPNDRPTNPALAAANAAAMAAEARRKEALRLKALEKKAQDARALRLMKNRMFVKLFNLGAEEELIEDYSCAIRKAILLHGRLYLSWNHLCFFSSIFSHKTVLVVPVKDILLVSAASVALLFDNSIKVFVQTGPLPVPKIHPVTGQIVPIPGAPVVDVPAPTPPQQQQQQTASGDAGGAAGTTSASSTPAKPPSVTASPSLAAATSPSSEPPATTLDAPASSTLAPSSSSSTLSALPAASNGSTETTQPRLSSPTTPSVTVATEEMDSSSVNGSTAAVASDDNGGAGSSPSSDMDDGAAESSQQQPPPQLSVNPADLVYSDPLPTTSNASLELNATQLNYLVAIAHPNIAQHFFASFLMRDHCLALLEGLLKKRREMHPAWVAMQATWRAAEDKRAQVAAAAEQEKAKQERQQAQTSTGLAPNQAAADAIFAGFRTPPVTPSSSSAAAAAAAAAAAKADAAGPGSPGSAPSASTTRPRSATAETVADGSYIAGLRTLPLTPSSAHNRSLGSSAAGDLRSTTPPTTTSLASRSSPALKATVRGSGESKSSSSADAKEGSDGGADQVVLPEALVAPRLDFGSAPVPDDDFSSVASSSRAAVEWEELVDARFPGLSARTFFALFLSDAALWSTCQYALSAGRGDADWKMSSWHDAASGALAPSCGAGLSAKQRAGPWVRDSKYVKQIKDSPLGPPQTRVHQIATYTCAAASSPSLAESCTIKVETRSLTPDVPFGDNMHVLERTLLEDIDGGSSGAGRSVRVRVYVGVRLKASLPWKMRPFVSIIKSKTNTDVRAWYVGWIASVQHFLKTHPRMVQKAIQRETGEETEPNGAAAVAAAEAAEEQAAVTAPADSSAINTGSADAASSIFAAAASISAASAAASAAAAADSSAAIAAAGSSLPSLVPAASVGVAELLPLSEWGWLRTTLSHVPVLSSHTDAVMDVVSKGRRAAGRHFSGGGAGFLSAALLVWALLSLVLSSVGMGASFGGSFSSPVLLLCAALLAALLARRSAEERTEHLLTQLSAAQQLAAQQARDMQLQLHELRSLVQQLSASASASAAEAAAAKRIADRTLHVNEEHFSL